MKNQLLSAILPIWLFDGAECLLRLLQVPFVCSVGSVFEKIINNLQRQPCSDTKTCLGHIFKAGIDTYTDVGGGPWVAVVHFSMRRTQMKIVVHII